MKRVASGALCVMAALLVLVPARAALAFEASGEAGADFMSTYVWRGQNLGGNEGVVQPYVGITAGNFGAGLWADYDSEGGEHVETDLTLSYAVPVNDKVSLEVGYIYYALDAAADTTELYASLGFDMVLSPAVTLYYDIDQGEGGFLVVSAGHSFGLARDMSLDVGVSASMNLDNEIMSIDEDADGDIDEFTDLYNGEVSVALAVPVTDNVTVTPKAAYTAALSDDAEDAITGLSLDGDDEQFYGGVGVSVAF